MILTAASLLDMNKEELLELALIDMKFPSLLSKNIGCIRCKNCNKCHYCLDCISCNHCSSCAKCYDCLDCTCCDNCTTCSDCMFCMYITNGHNLMLVAFGVQLTKEQYIALKEKLT